MSVYFRKRKDGTAAWYYDFMHKGTRYRGVGGTTKTQAVMTLNKVRSEVWAGKYEFSDKSGNPRFEQFANKYLSRRTHLRSQLRDDLSVRTLLAFFRGKYLLAITPSDVEEYILKRKKDGVSNATINRELACLKHMYTLAIRWGDATKSPVRFIQLLEEPPGRTRYLSQEEASLLLQSCNAYLHPIVFTALNTGMRLGEILTLKWSQVYIDHTINPYVELRRTKSNKSRFVPLNDDMIRILESLERTSSDHVFTGPNGIPLKSVKKSFKNALRKAGISDFRFHDLRHTFASHFMMRGGDMLTLKSILGHSSLKMVERYAHLAESHRTRQVNNLTGLFSICHLFATSEKNMAESAQMGAKKEPRN